MAIDDAPALILGAGLRAARLQPQNYTPVDGDWCFVVGSDVHGVFDTVEDGDLAGVRQQVDFTTLTLVTFAAAMRQTEGLRAAKARGLEATYPTGFTGGEDLQLAIDGGSTQVISFADTDQSLQEVVDRINATLSGAEATADNNQLAITSDTSGASSSVEIVGGTARVTLGFSLGTDTGQRVTFALRVYVAGTKLYELFPDVDETISFQTRTINVKSFTGSQYLRMVVEAVS